MDPIQTSDVVLSYVKKSNLHFSLQETPFSVYITIRKRFIKDGNNQKQGSFAGENCCQLLAAIETLKSENIESKEQFAAEQEESNNIIQNLQTKLEKAKIELSNLFYEKNEIIKTSDKTLSDKESELATFKNTITALKDENKKLKLEKKSSDKTTKTNEKEITNLKSKVENLSDNFKKIKNDSNNQTNENKKLKNEKEKLERTLQKKLKPKTTVSTSTSTVSLSSTSTNTLGSFTLANKATNTTSTLISTKASNTSSTFTQSDTSKSTSNQNLLQPYTPAKASTIKPPTTKYTSVEVSCQTDQHPDMPYEITLPLPPIFNSQLFHHTKPINFLARSLPSLDSICWGPRIEDNLTDQVEEALAEMYDREIDEFYLSERERSRATRNKTKIEKTEETELID